MTAQEEQDEVLANMVIRPVSDESVQLAKELLARQKPKAEDPGTEEFWRAWAKTPQARKESVNPDADVEALLATGMISKAGSHRMEE